MMNMNKKLFLVIVGIVIFMGGCSLAPKYTKPEAPIPADLPTGAADK